VSDEPGGRGHLVVNRSIRMRAGLWEAAAARAEREGRSMSDVIREALTVYAAGGPPRVVEDIPERP
jgi:hypothetical protein